MKLEIASQVLVAERPPTRDSELSSVASSRVTAAQKLVAGEPCLAAMALMAVAVRFGASGVQMQCQQRQWQMSFVGGSIPDSFLEDEEMYGLWWLLLHHPCKAQLSLVTEHYLGVLRWDGRQVLVTRGPNPEGLEGGIEFTAHLEEEETPILSAMADKRMMDGIRQGLFERARVYPLPLHIQGVLWEWPLDIKLERVCSFTHYDLVEVSSGQPGFAVAHPWAHGCRYWLRTDGRIIDMVSLGASDTQNASGNICSIPAFEEGLQPQRTLNLLRKRGSPGVELSLVRTLWGKSSFLPGFENYLLSPRTVVFGVMPQIRVQMRPMLARRLFMQTDKMLEANVVVPIRDGLALDPVYFTTKSGGLNIIALAPPELAVTRQGRSLADKEAATAWARQLVEECLQLQAPMNS